MKNEALKDLAVEAAQFATEAAQAVALFPINDEESYEAHEECAGHVTRAWDAVCSAHAMARRGNRQGVLNFREEAKRARNWCVQMMANEMVRVGGGRIVPDIDGA